jgi:hypothetical protein
LWRNLPNNPATMAAEMSCMSRKNTDAALDPLDPPPLEWEGLDLLPPLGKRPIVENSLVFWTQYVGFAITKGKSFW